MAPLIRGMCDGRGAERGETNSRASPSATPNHPVQQDAPRQSPQENHTYCNPNADSRLA